MNKIINNTYCSSINNIEIIKQSQNHYKYRLLKELTELSKQSDLHINIVDEKKIIINIINNTYISSFHLVLDKYYPFSPPEVIFFLNNNTDTSPQNYIQILGLLNFMNFKINLNNSGLECMCCSTLVCKDNWTPKKSLKNVINEIKIIVKEVGKKRKQIILNKILKKNLGYTI